MRWHEHVALETEMYVATTPTGIVVTQTDGTLCAYDHDGSVRWRHQHDATFTAAPVVASDGTVIVGNREGRVVAYTANGTPRWEQTTPQGLFAPHLNDATPFRIAGDSVVLAHPRGMVYAFALADGTIQWSVEIDGRTHRPAIKDEQVFLTTQRYTGGKGDVVTALSLIDGAMQWRKEHAESISIGPGVHDDLVYTADIQGQVVARSTTDGREQWRVQITGDPWLSTIPVVFGEQVWVGTLHAGLYGLTKDGVQTHVEIETPTTPAVGNDRLYVGSSAFGSGSGDTGGFVLALTGDGTEAWRTPTRGYPRSQLHYRDGYVVIGTDTGVVEQLGAADGTRRWRRFERPAQLPAPVVGPGTVYCGSRSGGVTGYRVTDGTSHLWHVSFDGSVSVTPTVAGQTVVAGSTSGEIAGTAILEHTSEPRGRLTRTPTPDPNATPDPHIDAPVPEPRWRKMMAGPISDIGYGTTHAYLGSGTSVVSVTPTGRIRWEADVGGRVRGAPAVGNGTVYAATTNGAIVALAAADGTEQWRHSTGKYPTAPSVAQSDDTTVLVSGTETAVVALDASSGAEQWRVETGRVRGTPAVSNDLVVVGDETGVLRGLALADGSEQWRVTTKGAIHGSPAIAAEVAYVGSRDRHLYAISTTDGSVDWRVKLQDWVDGSPAIAYGAVFVVDQSGQLSAIVGDQ